MNEPTSGSTAIVDPPVTPPVVPPAVTPPVVPPVTTPETPPVVTPPVTPPAPLVVTPPVTPPVSADIKLEVPKDGLLTKEYVDQFQKDAIAAGLSQDEAKDLLDTQYRAVKDYNDRSTKSLETEKERWKEMSKADPEIGGDNLNKTTELSKRVVDKFGNDAFKKLLNDTGFGSYPEVLRFLSKVGNAFSEDNLRPGNPSSGGTQKSREEILFANSTAGN